MTSWTRVLSYCSERPDYLLLRLVLTEDQSTVLWLHRQLLRIPSRVELKSQGWWDNVGPICPGKNTERISSSTSLWQNPSAKWRSSSCIWQSSGVFVMSMIEFSTHQHLTHQHLTQINPLIQFSFALVHQHLNQIEMAGSSEEEQPHHCRIKWILADWLESVKMQIEK